MVPLPVVITELPLVAPSVTVLPLTGLLFKASFSGTVIVDDVTPLTVTEVGTATSVDVA